MNNPNFLDKLDFISNIFIFPLIISVTFVLFFTWFLTRKERDVRKFSLLEFTKFTFTLHPDKGLMQQGLLWISIITPIVYFLKLLSIATSGYILRLDGEGFKIFASIATLPLAVLSLSLPLSVLVARFHSSQQTAEQIKATRQKNNTDLFHSHRKELFSYFDQIGEFKYHENLIGKNKIHPRLHRLYFKGKPQDGIPEFVEIKFINIETKLRATRRNLILVMTDSNPSLTFSLYLANFCSGIYHLSLQLGLPENLKLIEDSPQVPCKIKNEELHLGTVGVTTDEAVSALKLAENFFQNLCDFANYDSPYFIDSEEREEFNEVLRKVNKSLEVDRVIEKLHANEIYKAFVQEKNKRWFPKSSNDQSL